MFYEALSHIISAFSFSGWRARVQVTSSSHCPSYEGRPGATLFDGYISLRNSRAWHPIALSLHPERPPREGESTSDEVSIHRSLFYCPRRPFCISYQIE